MLKTNSMQLLDAAKRLNYQQARMRMIEARLRAVSVRLNASSNTFQRECGSIWSVARTAETEAAVLRACTEALEAVAEMYEQCEMRLEKVQPKSNTLEAIIGFRPFPIIYPRPVNPVIRIPPLIFPYIPYPSVPPLLLLQDFKPAVWTATGTSSNRAKDLIRKDTKKQTPNIQPAALSIAYRQNIAELVTTRLY